MEYIYICPKCGSTYGAPNKEGMTCSACNVFMPYSGYTDKEWYAMKLADRNEIKDLLVSTNAVVSSVEIKRMIDSGKSVADIVAYIRAEEQNIREQNQQIEIQKQTFANSFEEYYEYDVVTIINEDHGQIDKNRMMAILSEHARQGWRLHSIYSNELGKNAVRVLGFGVNSTACEDVLIFERRIERLPEE